MKMIELPLPLSEAQVEVVQKQEFNVPATLQELHSAPTLTEQAANFHATGSSDTMEDTLDTLEEIIMMLDVLHTLREIE